MQLESLFTACFQKLDLDRSLKNFLKYLAKTLQNKQLSSSVKIRFWTAAIFRRMKKNQITVQQTTEKYKP